MRRRALGIAILALVSASLAPMAPVRGDVPEDAAPLGLRRGASWTYVYKTAGLDHAEDGVHRWSYEATYRETIVRVRHVESFTAYEARRTLLDAKGEPPADGLSPSMGTRYYLVRGGEPAYAKWHGYSVVTPPAYEGTGVYLLEGPLSLHRMNAARVLYVLPLRAPSAWHDTIEEREHAGEDLFLSGPRVERKLGTVQTPLGPRDDCYAVAAPSTTTQDSSVVCDDVGLVERTEVRRAGSLVYRAETRLLSMSLDVVRDSRNEVARRR